jgi:hypothetical protein
MYGVVGIGPWMFVGLVDTVCAGIFTRIFLSDTAFS